MSTVEQRGEARESGRELESRVNVGELLKPPPQSCLRGLIALIITIGGGLILHLVVGKNEPLQNETALYTQSVSSQLKTLLEQDGVTITAYEPIDPGAKNYDDVVRTVAAGNPDVIYAATYYPEGGLIAKAIYQQKVASKCLADYGSYDSAFVTTAGTRPCR